MKPDCGIYKHLVYLAGSSTRLYIFLLSIPCAVLCRLPIFVSHLASVSYADIPHVKAVQSSDIVVRSEGQATGTSFGFRTSAISEQFTDATPVRLTPFECASQD